MRRVADTRARGDVVAAVGPGAAALAADALRRLGDERTATMELCVAGVALATAEPWRIAVRRGPAGLVALAIAGGAEPAERRAALLAEHVARRWRTRGFEHLGVALMEAAARLGDDLLVIAAGGEALRVAVAGGGVRPLVLRTGANAVVSSTSHAFPVGSAPETLDLTGPPPVVVEARPPGARLEHAA
jgi:hypothetical protein